MQTNTMRRRKPIFGSVFNVGSQFSNTVVSMTNNTIMESNDIYKAVLASFGGANSKVLKESYHRKVAVLWVISVILTVLYLASFVVYISFAAGTQPLNQIRPSVLKHITVYDPSMNAFVEQDVFISPPAGYLIYPVVLAFLAIAALAALVPVSFGAKLAYRYFYPAVVVRRTETTVITRTEDDDPDSCWNGCGCCYYDDYTDTVTETYVTPNAGFPIDVNGGDGTTMLERVPDYTDDDVASHGGAYYMEVLMFGLNRVHWIEVSLFSALLVWICGQLAGINDIFQLVGMMMLTVTGILASGLLQEASNSTLSMYSRKLMLESPNVDTSRTQGEGWWIKYKCVVTWWPYLLGTIPYLTVWSFLFAYLGMEAKSVPVASLLPWYVWAMIVGVGVLGLFFWAIIFVRFVQLQSSVNMDRRKWATRKEGEDMSAMIETSMKKVVEYNYYYELWKQGNKAVIVLYATWIMFAAMFY